MYSYLQMKDAPEIARKELAGQMSHQFSTHNKSYALTDLEERCERADRVRSILNIGKTHMNFWPARIEIFCCNHFVSCENLLYILEPPPIPIKTIVNMCHFSLYLQYGQIKL